MSDSIPIQPTTDQLAELVKLFNARRPLLSEVARAMKSEAAEYLDDEGLETQVSQIVLSGEQFAQSYAKRPSDSPLIEITSQVRLLIVAKNADEIESIREALEELYQSVEEGWKKDRSQLNLKVLIPTHAKPEGYRDRLDVPVQAQISIVATDAEPQVTVDGDRIPSLALIMKGGGIKGLAYVGALDLLRDYYRFNWFVGTSAGAITAILLAAGYTVEEMKGILEEKNFKDFFDAPFYKIPTNLLFKKGMHPAQEFTDWMDRLLTAKFGGKLPVTLGQIQEATGNRITVYASQKGRKALTFDSEDNDDVSAAYAARCSMSIPIVFTPQSEQGRWAFDGGLQNNFPVRQLTDVHGEVPFVCLYLGSENYEPQKETSVILHVLGIFMSQGEVEFVDDYKEQIVIVDPRPISTLDFDINDSEKSYLLTCGKIGAMKHIWPEEEHDSLSELDEAVEAKETFQPEVDRMHNRRIWKSRIKTGLGLLVGFLAFYFAAKLVVHVAFLVFGFIAKCFTG